MTRTAVVILACFIPAGIAAGLSRSVTDPSGTGNTSSGVPSVRAERVVYVCGEVTDAELIALTAMVSARGRGEVVLLDRPQSGQAVREFLAAYRPGRVIPVGAFAGGTGDLEKRLGVAAATALQWQRGPPLPLWRALFSRADRVVACPPAPRRLLLHAACLAGALGAPLCVLRDEEDAAVLDHQLADWHTRKVFLIGDAARRYQPRAEIELVTLADEEAVSAAYLERQSQRGPIQSLVVANPDDNRAGLGNHSVLAPWVALQRRAALLLTNAAGNNVEALVLHTMRQPALRQAEFLFLVAGLQAVPTERRPNPVPGKDAEIEMEPLTPRGTEPFSFATGRLFHQDLGVVALVLARQQLLGTGGGPRRALVVSNPGGGLPLMEVFSRNTRLEFQNRGYATTALFEKEVSRDKVRQLLPAQDIFLWEGHYRTLIDDYGFLTWDEPLRPALVFLQSCLALNETEAQPLFTRGAVAVVGSSTRTYAASGAAFSLAFFDAFLYGDQSLGGSLRQAKNFLQAYALLKEKRLGERAPLRGVNQRSAWAFTLWGDPTLQLPRPEPPHDALPAIRTQVRGNEIVVSLPDDSYPTVSIGRYESHMRPNARLAGLLTGKADDEKRPLVPFIFAEVKLPEAPSGKMPRLHSRVPEKNWVFCWDGRRSCGYLLVTPRGKSQKELRFRISWE